MWLGPERWGNVVLHLVTSFAYHSIIITEITTGGVYTKTKDNKEEASIDHKSASAQS
jgi:hypothetical protein